jgi:hypothetical protein
MTVYYVGGSQRAGTTLLQILLCQAMSTNPMIREASYLRGLVQVYSYGKSDFEADTKDYFSSIEELQKYHSCILEEFIERVRNKYSGVTNLVLKEPHLTMLFPELYELLPESMFIVLIRDPRDIIASMINVGESISMQGKYHFFQDRNMLQLCNHVKSFYMPCFTCKNKSFARQVLFIRYEDLVTKTAETIKTLVEYTGLQIEDKIEQSLINDKLGVKALPERYVSWYKNNNLSRITSASVGKYRETLSVSEIKKIELHASGLMRQYGYL